MEQEGFVYRWDNTKTGEYYIGAHMGHQDDGYVSGGRRLLEAMDKDYDNSFQRTIIYQGKHFYDAETLIILALDVCQDKMSYNARHANRRKANETRLRNLEKRKELAEARRVGKVLSSRIVNGKRVFEYF